MDREVRILTEEEASSNFVDSFTLMVGMFFIGIFVFLDRSIVLVWWGKVVFAQIERLLEFDVMDLNITLYDDLIEDGFCLGTYARNLLIN